MKHVDDVDKRFDTAERVWDRLQKLLLKVLGGIVGISLAVYVGYDQLRDRHEESVGPTIEQLENKKEHEDPIGNTSITKKSYDIDPSGYRKGDTIYIDYYSDGYVEKYYTDGESYYE
jgi:hypothetical protein